MKKLISSFIKDFIFVNFFKGLFTIILNALIIFAVPYTLGSIFQWIFTIIGFSVGGVIFVIFSLLLAVTYLIIKD